MNSAWIAMIGTLSGVVTSSVLTMAKTAYEGRLSRIEYKKRSALFFCHKLTYMLSSMVCIEEHFESNFAFALTSGLAPGMAVRGMNRICDEITFSDDNIWAITMLLGADGFNSMGYLDNQFNVTVRAVDLYKELRNELEKLFPKPDLIEGIRLSYTIRIEDEGVILPRIAELDQMVAAIIEQCAANKQAILLALETLLTAKKFPFPKMKIVLPGRVIKACGAEAGFEDRLNSKPIPS